MIKPAPDVVLGGTFFPHSYAMVSADPKRSDLWQKVIGKSGRIWLYQDDGSRCWVDGGKGSRGCGGRTLTFSLIDGGTVELTGPWHSNCGSFFADTGIDISQNYWSWGCVGTSRVFNENTERSGIGNIIWFDPEPVKGLFDRVDLIAWELQQKHPDLKLEAYRESEGGSSLGSVSEPASVKRARKDPDQLLSDRIIAEMFDL